MGLTGKARDRVSSSSTVTFGSTIVKSTNNVTYHQLELACPVKQIKRLRVRKRSNLWLDRSLELAL